MGSCVLNRCLVGIAYHVIPTNGCVDHFWRLRVQSEASEGVTATGTRHLCFCVVLLFSLRSPSNIACSWKPAWSHWTLRSTPPSSCFFFLKNLNPSFADRVIYCFLQQSLRSWDGWDHNKYICSLRLEHSTITSCWDQWFHWEWGTSWGARRVQDDLKWAQCGQRELL